MKLYEVTNGSIGESYVKVFVIADTDTLALEQAKIKYKDDSSSYDSLTAEVLCGDTSKMWASEVRDY